MENNLGFDPSKNTAAQSADHHLESTIWTGKSSQILNIKYFALYGIIAIGSLVLANYYSGWISIVAGLCALRMLYSWFYINTATYTLTNQRIIRKVGVFNRETFEIELYRVKDVLLLEPFIYRIFSLGNIRLVSSQKTTHNLVLDAIHKPTELREQIRKLVETRRSEKGVGEFDTGNY
ncbi:PH domain-containing protein [Chitinophaga sp. SYP-B3965]|uniref:PH domain-containing protein n=1 Tax=Chitinophaga sp. SYP-B3965 TaxID=2663120 RepID=UPI00129A0290|nr:PH domain-containing protein [Chitinophaga sp. SYP-B3965]MRG44484.1 PH domain-containing protein [Chitinophaga sp. SYP-B3965]